MARPLVVDASVALKWFFRDRDEADAPLAIALLAAVGDGRVRLLQPPHFVAEVGAVLARESPEAAEDGLLDLLQVTMRVVADASVHLRAVAMARALRHHLFDTLYHAVALEEDAVLVTSDDRYFRKARGLGRIARLVDLPALLGADAPP